MQQDQKLKDILQLGPEGASAHFTASVMKRVNDLSTTPFQYQPLVSPRLKKAFLLTCAVLVASILLLCLLIASPELPFADLAAIRPYTAYLYDHSLQILTCTLCFWIVFLINAVAEKNLLRRKLA